jgi:hypothetical protein
MLIQKIEQIIFYFKHSGLTMEMDQETISSTGLIELLKKNIKEKYPVAKSFRLSLVQEDTFEVEISILNDLSWKIG